jgi:kinesin family member C1
VCIFAYGQTGSGKTYTMEGPPYSSTFQPGGDSTIDEISGILPRTAEFIFSEMERLNKQSSKQYHLEISSIEVYCDNVKDLYGAEGTNQEMQLITVKNRVMI